MAGLQRTQHRLVKHGISLLELSISVLILGILAAIATPVYSNSLQRYRVEVAAQRLVQDIVQAQQLARLSSATRSILISSINDNYTISGLQSIDHPSETYKVDLNQSPYSVDIASLVSSNEPATQQPSLTLTFDRFGMPDQGISVTVQSSNFQKRIVVATTSGRVRIE